MRSLIVPVLILGLAGCTTPMSSQETGQGTVIGVDYDPTTYYSNKECVKKFGKVRCVTPKVKEQEDWDITIIDTGSHEEREIEVSQEVFANCTPGRFYNGQNCQ